MDSALESAMDVMTRLSKFFGKNNEKLLNNKVMLEMEQLDDEYSTTYAAAQHNIYTQKEQSSESSEIFSIDLLRRMNISDESETYRKGGCNLSQEIGIFDSYSNVCNSVQLKTSIKQTGSTTEYQKNATVFEAQPQQALNRDMSMPNEQYQEFHCPVVGQSSMNATATPFEPNASNNTPPTIGQDLWRQLKRVQIPVFNGEKTTKVGGHPSSPASILHLQPPNTSYCNFSSTSLGRL